MSEYVYAGLTSQTVDVFLADSSSTTGEGLAALVYNTASLTCYYRKGATGTATAITLATQTVGGAWSSGGFVQVDATNMPGVYRLDVPDTVVSAEGFVTIYFQGAANLVPTALRVDCRALPSDMIKISGDATAADDLDARLDSVLADTNDLQTNQGDWATASGFATPSNVTDAQDTVIASGTSAWTTASGADIADAVWDEVLHKSTHNVAQSAGKQLRQVATIVAAEGQVNDASATTTSFNSDLTETIDGFYNDQVLIFTDGPLVGRAEVISSYTGATKSFVFDEALPSVPSSGDSFTILGNHVHTKSQIASAIWDEVASGHLTSGTFGGIIESGSSAWTTATGFATPANVTAAQDTIIASGSDWVTASGFNTVVPDNSGVAAIQVKTDQMNFGVSNQLDANVKSINDATINGSGTTGNKWRGA